MPVRIREAHPQDHAAVAALNTAALPAVSEASVDRIARLADCAAYFRVAVDDGAAADGPGAPAEAGTAGRDAGRIVGFLLAMTPESDYDSPNFLWFQGAFDSFVYVDRIVVAPELRGEGLGARFYADLEDFTRGRAPRITCEVNTRPRNEGSLRFHERMGFREVGTQETEGGRKAVSLMEKPLGPETGGR